MALIDEQDLVRRDTETLALATPVDLPLEHVDEFPGLPIMVRDYPELAALVDKHECGWKVRSAWTASSTW